MSRVDIVERLQKCMSLASSYDGLVLVHISILKEAAAEVERLRPVVKESLTTSARRRGAP